MFPDDVLEIARNAAAAFPSDINAAVATAEAQIRELPTFGDIVDQLVNSMVRELVHRARHEANRAFKNSTGAYGTQARVQQASPAVAQVYQSVYSYCIGATVLGELLGKDLPKIAASERCIADGHTFNAKLCEKLSDMVEADKRVRDCVTERKLETIWRRLRREVYGDAA